MNNRLSLLLTAGLIAAVAVLIPGCLQSADDHSAAAGIERIGPEQTRQLVSSGQALLICSYNDKRCKPMMLEGAMLLSELDAKAADLSKDQPLIFYCS